MPPIGKRKRYGHTISVTQGSNKVLACSKADWSPVKTGSVFIIENDNKLYRIVAKEKVSYTKDVTVYNSTQLKVAGNTGSNFVINDNVLFTNNEYEVSDVAILKGGSGYVEGDILSPDGGTCKFNSLDEIDLNAQIKVDAVGEDGEVTSISIKSNGEYNVAPKKKSSTKGGSGSDVELSFITKLREKRIMEERSIIDIEHKEDSVILHLSHALPPRVVKGTVSTAKWEATLDAIYLGASRDDIGYEILKDFTPNLSLPLIRGDVASSSILYNEAVMTLDKKITEQQARIDVLSAEVEELKK